MGVTKTAGKRGRFGSDAHVAEPCPESWSLSPTDVLDALDVDRSRGLSSDEVARRRQHFGRNRLREARARSAWKILWDQLESPIVALLSAATVVAFLFGERLEASAILVVLVVNAAIGFWTEWQALRAMDALRKLGSVHTMVRRDGEPHLVPADELVPGDIVILDAGDVLTADLRLVDASRLQADESTLTGESLPIDKRTEATPAETALPDRHSMLFKGTSITRGSGEGVVVATGMQTELGHISRLVEEAEPQSTPLEARLDRLGRRLLVLTLVIAAGVALANVLSGRDVYLSIEIALALAVAAVPEGLPIVATLALARGMARMARRNALVEHLAAVETLGSTSILLVDKTGTLTENRMVVGELALPGEPPIHFEPDRGAAGAFVCDGVEVDVRNHAALQEAMRIAALCNNAALADDDSRPLGDPTEVALLSAARTAGLDRAALLEAMPELREVAFDPDVKMMATLHAHDDAVFAAVKGAPETVVPECSHRAGPDRSQLPLDDADREAWLARAETMASRGQRVLALARKTLRDPKAFRYEGMTIVGLAGLLDPPRPGVRDAIDASQAAGIRVIMVTGDHGGTASHIAQAVGLTDPDEGAPPTFLDARSWADFGALDSRDRERVLAAPVIARSTPRQKLQMISLFQDGGAVVAMTGDGVNDAPALKKADIGIAMGRRGTQVAREAADMVLRDDELGTIVSAVAQGRAIFANIRKFVVYLLSCNLSEILAVAIASLAAIPLPLLPLQILFLNLVTDVFPALALGVGEGAPSLMKAPPRDPGETVIMRRHWMEIFGFGALIAASVLAALILAQHLLGKSDGQATTISFLTLALAQLWHVFDMRDRESGWIANEITGNPWVWGALALCIVLVAASIFWPPLAQTLSIEDPGRDGWGMAIGMSLVPVGIGQIVLGWRRMRTPSRARTRT